MCDIAAGKQPSDGGNSGGPEGRREMACQEDYSHSPQAPNQQPINTEPEFTSAAKCAMPTASGENAAQMGSTPG